jgi:hypothetical protein
MNYVEVAEQIIKKTRVCIVCIVQEKKELKLEISQYFGGESTAAPPKEQSKGKGNPHPHHTEAAERVMQAAKH